MKTLKHIVIRQGRVWEDGQLRYASGEAALGRMCRAIYKEMGLDYPKFYKMSALSKLGFLAAEMLLEGLDLGRFDPDRICLFLANTSSSLHTDGKYQESLKQTPSPATFVYTLPNILIGEICIRHGIHGEGLFFIREEQGKDFVREQSRLAMEEGSCDLALAGWVEVDLEGHYEADLELLLYIQ